MILKKYSLILMILAFFVSKNSVNAQIYPPDLLCITNETLIWDLPNNTCGAFQDYQILFSTSQSGPYSVLTTITDQSQTSYNHPNIGGITFYYFMVSHYDCPGEPLIFSDTLDNNPPIRKPIKSVSVSGNNVIINWNASPSPEVIGYIIYKETDIGNVPIDTVFGTTTTYVDINASPNDQSETYYVLAIDGCWNTSLFGLSQSSIYVTSEINVCDQSISLSWNKYVNWEYGIQKQEIWIGVNGSPPQLIEELSPTDSTYTVTDAIDDTEYCILIKAYHDGPNDIAVSNELCSTLDIVEPVRTLVLKNLSYDDSDNILIDWIWNISAEVESVNIFSSSTQSDYLLSKSLLPPDPMIQEVVENLGKYGDKPTRTFFKIKTIDDCGDIIWSNYGSTINLLGTAEEGYSNFMIWTPFTIEGATLNNYEIYKMDGNISNKIGDVDASTVFFRDYIDKTNPDEFLNCYFVVGVGEIVLPNGSIEEIRSISNKICIEQKAKVFAPSAFVPDGFNYEFKPRVLFGDQVEYYMVILNRWGERIFESHDILDGWNGKKDGVGKPMSQGIYIYQIEITQPSGKKIIDKGSVMLIR